MSGLTNCLARSLGSSTTPTPCGSCITSSLGATSPGLSLVAIPGGQAPLAGSQESARAIARLLVAAVAHSHHPAPAAQTGLVALGVTHEGADR